MFRNSAKLVKNVIKKSSSVKTSTRSFFRIVDQNKRGIRLGFGRYQSDIEPGLRLRLPIYHSIHTIDIREKVHTIPTMQVISADNVTFKVDASIQYQVLDAKKALLNVSYVEDSLME